MAAMHLFQRPPAPVPALRRLPAYLRLLQVASNEGRRAISCADIAAALDLDQSQVRKDLALTGISGRPRVGYELPALIEAIEEFLGWRSESRAVLIGVGNLGTALLGYPGFAAQGLRIVAACDVDPATVGRVIKGLRVFDLRELAQRTTTLDATIGIVTVPAAAAQQVAVQLVHAGFHGIWNFTPARLAVPPGVVVEDVDLSASLAVLSHRLAGLPQEVPA